MKTRKRALTAQIKPETRNAIMDQLALAADEIEALKHREEFWKKFCQASWVEVRKAQRRWWHRFAWWREPASPARWLP